MRLEEKYNALCSNWSDIAWASSLEIVPIIIDLIKPQSVVDVGCGSGTWLASFQSFGIQDILGLDGEYLRKDLFKIPEDKFLRCDLNKPIKLSRKFDLVLCLEVAEHLSPDSSNKLIDTLTSLGSVVFFSAAIPFQGGINHINEQWPDYWADLFVERGFNVVDCIRPKIWGNNKVNWVYQQNCLMFAPMVYIQENDKLCREFEKNNKEKLAIVHPFNYLKEADPHEMSFFKTLRKLAPIFINAIKRRI